MQLLVYTTIGLYTTIGRYDFRLQHYWSIRLLELVYMIICLYDNLSHFVNFFCFVKRNDSVIKMESKRLRWKILFSGGETYWKSVLFDLCLLKSVAAVK